MFWNSVKEKAADSENTHQCIHCGQPFDLNKSDGWCISQEQFTCNWCYMAGKRDARITMVGKPPGGSLGVVV